MEMKKINVMKSISLIAMGIASIILICSNLIDLELSDIAIRICGVIDVIALFLFVFTTVKKTKNK